MTAPTLSAPGPVAQAVFEKHAHLVRRTMRWPHLHRRSMAKLRRKFMSRHTRRQLWRNAP